MSWTALIITLHLALMPIMFLGVSAALSKETDAGMILIFIWPGVLGGFILLAFDGILMIRAALRPHKPASKRKRIILGTAGVLPILPLLGLIILYCTAQIASGIVANRARTPLSNNEAQQFIESCKVRTIERKDNDNNGTLSLMTDSLDFFEKNFGYLGRGGHRLFDANDFDQLLRVIRSPEVRNKCDHIYTNYLTDKKYQKLPSETNWVTTADVERMLEACAIDELHYGSPPFEIAKHDPPKDGILSYNVQEPSGPYTHVYIEHMAAHDKDRVLDLGRKKQSTCQYHRPGIIMP
jgi:hypothetical protein